MVCSCCGFLSRATRSRLWQRDVCSVELPMKLDRKMAYDPRQRRNHLSSESFELLRLASEIGFLEGGIVLGRYIKTDFMQDVAIKQVILSLGKRLRTERQNC